MKNTIKSLIALAVLGFASVANAALIPASGTVNVFNTPNDGTPDAHGGEFQSIFSNGYSTYTFCLEREVALGGTTFKYIIDGTITNGTAYLMKQFAIGQLSGYSYDTTGEGSARDVEAGKLQKAIWELEGQADGEKNSYYDMAAAMVGFGDIYLGNEVVRIVLTHVWNGKSGAWVEGNFQDQVVFVADSGATLALLGLGLAGLAIARRRR